TIFISHHSARFCIQTFSSLTASKRRNWAKQEDFCQRSEGNNSSPSIQQSGIVKFAKSISIIVFVLLLFLSGGAFTTPAASPWTSVTSKNFPIAGDASEAQLKAV